MSKIETILVEVEITKERIGDMIVGALEGGSNYWYWIPENEAKKIYAVTKSGAFSERILEYVWGNRRVVAIHDAEDPDEKLGEFSFANIKKGLKLMAKEQSEHFGDMQSESDDATTADVLFQFITLGELVYG